ncbi:hypothetical protein FB451DRAFT_630594 [Mycena latifolia]|nr:hypothetical protein FB451DRAFT_630594 [Mycena latifolia]
MTFTILFSALALSLLCGLAISIPLPDDNSTTLPVAPSTEALLPDFALGTAIDAANTLLLAPAVQIIAGLDPVATTEDNGPLYLSPPPSSPPPIASSLSLVTTTATNVLTDTQTLTEPPTTVTVSAAPSTVTDVVTVFLPTSPPPPSSTPTTPGPSGAKAAWAEPPQMTDLSAFNISAFPGGQQNLRLVTGIPAAASASPALLDPLLQPSGPPPPYIAWDNASTVLQLLYPLGSANPAAKPQGGAEFYATPLAITAAMSVSMGYSVFFPDDYDWVKGGKLPGLFGGRMACSGGDAALDCFSTRLMWRQHGAGELYLYAAKNKQTAALCADPQSVCDSAYGFSIGRGSFKFRAGGWTTVLQTVQLNTPGKQDGAFWLYVDGRLAIHRDDVFYRDVPPASAATKGEAPPKSSATPTSTSDPDDDDDDGGDILGPLLSGILDRRTAVQEVPRDARQLLLPVPTAEGLQLASDPREWAVHLAPAQGGVTTVTTTAPGGETTTTSTLFTAVTVYPTLAPGSEQAAPRTVPVGFIGIFFSTFFGGHGPAYATPKDQFAWFKDFELVFNR